jgi:hypothetical protein
MDLLPTTAPTHPPVTQPPPITPAPQPTPTTPAPSSSKPGLLGLGVCVVIVCL